MAGFGQLIGERDAALCPLCDGPCAGHETNESPLRFPDRLVHTDADGVVHDPREPKPEAKKQRGRGRRRAHHGPSEDRAHHGPAEDR